MCLEVAFKTGKSLCRSEGFRETVPDRRIGNWSIVGLATDNITIAIVILFVT